MSDVTRRDGLKLIAVAGAAASAGCAPTTTPPEEARPVTQQPPASPTPPPDLVLGTTRLAFPWATRDPFLFCVHHDDRYPAGNEAMGPDASLLAGRRLGMDFDVRDGFRMYHGRVVPGFPQHPHRGFETVTVVRRGLLDHSDSMGAAARYGRGDVQWLTAGRGILHAEMFPLLERESPNPVELFQIWLNLPSARKMVDPYFTMLWADRIPHHAHRDAAGRQTEVTLVAGRYGTHIPPDPPPASWASVADSDVAIWTLRMAAGAKWTLPAAAVDANRSLYFFRGSGLKVGGAAIPPNHRADLRPAFAVELEAGADEVEVLMLQGRPIGEPVARHGPFVMNTRAEIQQAYDDYRRTRFGGWPWRTDDHVHARTQGRFARHADGREERPA